MIKKYIKLFVKVSLNYTEDFIDLFDNHWVYMWGMVTFSFLQMSAIFLSINKEELARMKKNEYFNIILDLIRVSLPSEFIIYLNIPEINNIAIILLFLMIYYPFINIVSGIIINKNIQISQYMIRYFSIFRWFLFIPITNFLTLSLRLSSVYSFGQYFSVLSLTMVMLQALFIEYIFRNHQFRDSNLARKNPSAYTFIYVIIVFLLIISKDLVISKSQSVILFHLSMIILFFEYFDCFPISNSYLNQYYFRLMCIVEADTILLTFFLNSSWNSESIYFFQYMQLKIIVWYLSGHIQNLWFMKYIIVAQDLTEKRFLQFNREQLIKENNLIKNFLIKRKTSFFDVYAEYIYLLSKESVGNQNSKMQLIFIVTNHRINCINLSCYCHHHSFYIFKHEFLMNKISSAYKQIQPLTQNQKNRIKVKETQQDLLDDQMVSQQKINKFINVLFRETLKLQRSKPSDFKKEILILKHSSFITRQLDNPPQAYYDLKFLSNQNVNSSLHFQVLNRIISLALQNQIIKKQIIYLATQALEEGNTNIHHGASSYKQISLESILENIKYQEMITKGIKVIISLKIQFWNNYLNAETAKFQQIQDHLVIEIIKLQGIMAQYAQILKKNNSQSIISVRVTELYHMIITRDMREIQRNEHEFLEMIRKDRCIPEELLTSLKLLENQVEILITSILNDKGHILNKKTPRMAAFFNYDFASFRDIFNVKQLMPQFLAQIHDGLMDNYLHRGYSRIIKASDRDVFIMDADNFIRPVKLNLENFFAFKDDFNLIAALMQFKQNKQYIIFDITGRVQGASQQLFQSIKEKSDFIHKKNGNFKNIHKLGSLTREVFFSELFIFMLIPDIIQRVKNFLNEQRIMMEAAGYTDFGENSIMKYFIETGQKNIEISRFQKCELYVPANLQLIIQQYKELENQQNQCGCKMDTRFTQTINASKNTFKMMEKQQRKSKEIEDNNQFIKGFSMFDLEDIKCIDDHMSQHRIVYIFQGACFRYYIRMNLSFTLLAQTKYTSRNMAFFVLNVVEKKVPKNVLSHIIMDRLIKKNPSQFKRQEKLQNTLLTATQSVNDQQCQKKPEFIDKKLLKNQAPQSLFIKKNANWLQIMLRKESNEIEIKQSNISLHRSQQLQKQQEMKKSQEIQQSQQQFNYQNLRRDALTFTTDDQQLMKVKIQDGPTEQLSQNNIRTTLSIAVSDNEEQKKSENNLASSTEIKSRNSIFWCGLAAKIKEKKSLEKISYKHPHKFSEGDNSSYILHQNDYSNSDNQFDEDLTEKSSQVQDYKQGGELFQFMGNDKLIKDEDCGSVSSNRSDYIILGNVLMRQIFQSKSLTKGENKFIKLNIALTAIYFAFYCGLIHILISYQNQQLELSRNISFNLDLEMDYDKIIGSSSLQNIIPFIENSERRLFWAKATNQYFTNGSDTLKKHIYENQNDLVYLNNLGQKDKIAIQIFDDVQKGISTQKIEFMTLLQMISTATEQINSNDQNIRLSSLFLVYENYAELKNSFDKNNNFILSSFENLQKSFFISFISLYIILVVLILQILLLSLWANKQYNKYLKFLLLSITRIKIQEIEVEVKRLQNFQRVLTDNQKLWISQDIYQLFFFKEVIDHENKDMSKHDRTNLLNQKYEKKHRNKYDIFIFFFLASQLLIGFSVYGIFLMKSFIKNQNDGFKAQCDQQNLEINLSNFIHKLTKQMAQSSINLDDYLRLTYNQSIQLQQEINQYRIIIRQTKNNIQLQAINNAIFNQLYTKNLCEKNQFNQELQKSFQTLCQNNLDQGHLSLGINNIITGILGIYSQNNLQFMVENCEVELFIWNYYKVYSPYIQYIIEEDFKIISEKTLEEFNKLIIVKLLGLLLAILIAITALICVKYFKGQRKGNTLLLSLIPHEKLSQDITINLLKQLQQT